MPGRPPQVAWRCSRNELSGKAGAVHRIPGQEARPLGIDAHDDIGLEGAGD